MTSLRSCTRYPSGGTPPILFRRYAELGSVRLLKDELEARGIKSKSWTSAAGRVIGEKPFLFYEAYAWPFRRAEVVDSESTSDLKRVHFGTSPGSRIAAIRGRMRMMPSVQSAPVWA